MRPQHSGTAPLRTLDQIVAVTYFSLRSLPQRLGASAVIVVGIAGVVCVLVSVLAMSAGMIQTLGSSGRDDRAIVLRNGSAAEIGSILLPGAVHAIMDAPGIKRNRRAPLVCSEVLRLVPLRKQADGSEASGIIRGVGRNWRSVRSEIQMLSGRAFNPARHEVIVGRGAQKLFRGLQVGSRISTRTATWTVVGVFTANGDSHESELLTDADTLISASGGHPYSSSVTAVLESPDAFASFSKALATNPALSVDVMRERDYYARQSRTLARLLSWVAYVVGGIMAVGAFFGALNAMYSAVSTRAREIATLQALGFEAPATITAILFESFLLALLGGLIGAFVAWMFFNGNTVSTGSGAYGSLVFDLSVSPSLIALGVSLACAIGLIGGVLPALRAARLPLATALRAL